VEDTSDTLLAAKSVPEGRALETRGSLVLRGITKSFGGVRALRGASLSCKRGEVHALIGENGAGKSTLVKVLSGVVAADAGEIFLDGHQLHLHSPLAARSVGIVTVFQELSLIPDLTVASNLFYGIEPKVRAGRVDRRALRRTAAELLSELEVKGIDPSRTVRQLDLAQRQTLEICRALVLRPDVLVLDEPTSALLPEQVNWLFDKVRAFSAAGGVSLFISHRMEEVQQLCDQVTVFRGGTDVGSGAVAEMPESRLVELMMGRRVENVFPPRDVSTDDDIPICELQHLSSPPQLRDLSLQLRKGEIVGVGGLQGQGQLQLFLSLFGARVHTGRIIVQGAARRLHRPSDALAAGIGLIPEDRATEGLFLGLGIRDNISVGNLTAVSSGGLIRGSRERALIASTVEQLHIVMRNARQEVNALSGGNQQKVLLGRVLAQHPRLLLMYDATRGVDVGTKAEIYKLMRELTHRGISILFYSTDVTELANLAHRVIVLHDGEVRAELEGEELTEHRILSASVGAGRNELPT
jgi:ribose transport system ATP-binding protein